MRDAYINIAHCYHCLTAYDPVCEIHTSFFPALSYHKMFHPAIFPDKCLEMIPDPPGVMPYATNNVDYKLCIIFIYRL